MNSSQKKRLLSLDLRLFESAQLTKDGGVEQAILNLENVIYGGEASQAITDLLNSHNLFEFIFSGELLPSAHAAFIDQIFSSCQRWCG